jgi:hypothetical protein
LDAGLEDSEWSGRSFANAACGESGHQRTLKTVWHKTLRCAKIPYLRIYDLRSTYATRLSAGGVADESAGDAKVFKKYSQMKPQMNREACERSTGWLTSRGVLKREGSVGEGFGTF